MAIITIVKGTINVNDKFPNRKHIYILESQTYAPFITKNDIIKCVVVDTGMVKLDNDFILWILTNTKKNVLLIFSNGKIPLQFTKTHAQKITKNSLQYYDGTVNEKADDLFAILTKVIYSTNRGEVYSLLTTPEVSRMSYLIYMWLVSNTPLFPHNTGMLISMDILAVNKNNQRFAEMLAFQFKPATTRGRLAWNFPNSKKG